MTLSAGGHACFVGVEERGGRGGRDECKSTLENKKHTEWGEVKGEVGLKGYVNERWKTGNTIYGSKLLDMKKGGRGREFVDD